MNHHHRDASTSTGTTTLPMELVEDILLRLPVKVLLQLRCICKSWKTLISDSEFAKKYLLMSKASLNLNRHHLMTRTKMKLYYRKSLPRLWDAPIPSIFTTLYTSHFPLNRPAFLDTNDFTVCSCDGILCFTIIRDVHICASFPILWNPSIRRFNAIPRVEYVNPDPFLVSEAVRNRRYIYSFGYDNHTHTYKIVALSFVTYTRPAYGVHIYTLGTEYSSWRRIQGIPYHVAPINDFGQFVSGTVNWLRDRTIISLNLQTETYQHLLLPPTMGNGRVTLGVMNNCLCLLASNNHMSRVDVWIMGEFGNNESWNILYKVPYTGGVKVPRAKLLYTTEDDRLLIYYHHSMPLKLGVYDSKNGTFNMSELQHNSWMDPIVYNESLISP